MGTPRETQEPSAPPPFEAAPMAAPMPSPAQQPAAAVPASEPPRRRSTVREPAPISGAGEAAVPMPPLQTPSPAPVVISSGEAEAKPKRSGWWAKKLLGGD
jgi:ribonuclease E